MESRPAEAGGAQPDRGAAAPPPQRPSVRDEARRAAALGDGPLLAECTVEFYVGGGPGGQHRNKTASAVRLVHPPTGVTVTASERRSQAQNRGAELERLRARLGQLSYVAPKRRPTRPTRGSKERRLAGKKHQAQRKALRRSSDDR